MGGEVPVYILDRALDDDESFELLEQVKSFHGLTLLIRANYARGMDYAAIEHYWQQRANAQPFYKLVPQERDEEFCMDSLKMLDMNLIDSRNVHRESMWID